MKEKEVFELDEAAAVLGIPPKRLSRWIREGKAFGKKEGPGLTNPYRLHVTEVNRLKEIVAPPQAVTCGR